MIVYIFNSYFPDDSGFGKRCKMEIDALSAIDDITVFCRENFSEKNEIYISNGKKIDVVKYDVGVPVTEKPKEYMKIFYELYRNVSLFFGIIFKLNRLIGEKKRNVKIKKDVKLYVVSSPLTIPLIAYFLGKLHGISLEVLEFHDLEPELAKHIKKLDDKSLVVRIEYFLEKWMSRSYKKIIATSQAQADRIINRTKVKKGKVYVIPNSFPRIKRNKDKKVINDLKLDKNTFLLGYSGTLNFDYTISGLLKFLKSMPGLLVKIPSLKLMIIGDGDGLKDLKGAVKELRLEGNVIFTGKISNVEEYIEKADVLFIPWKRDEVTETILPTKLFEYMQAKKPVIAPNFGEFKRVLDDGVDALLYDKNEDLVRNIINLQKSLKLRESLGKNIYNKYMDYYQPKLNKEALVGIMTA